MTETKHKNVYVALAAAQAEMGALVKDTANEFFKSKYADLAAVVDACRPALNAHGLAYYHQIVALESGHTMRTVLAHGESDTKIECDVPLIVAKNDMQAFKSASTYAKRIGLESVTGLAPDDDDGNAAAKAPGDMPKGRETPKEPAKNTVSREFYSALEKQLRMNKTAADLAAFMNDADCKAARAKLPEDWYQAFMSEAKQMKAAFEAAVEGGTPFDSEDARIAEEVRNSPVGAM